MGVERRSSAIGMWGFPALGLEHAAEGGRSHQPTEFPGPQKTGRSYFSTQEHFSWEHSFLNDQVKLLNKHHKEVKFPPRCGDHVPGSGHSHSQTGCWCDSTFFFLQAGVAEALEH